MNETEVEKVVEIAISPAEDEATLAQSVMHKVRRLEDDRREMAELYRAEIRRLRFALSELGESE